LLTVMGLTAGGSLAFYTFTTYMQKYLVNTAGLPVKTVSILMAVVLLLYMGMQPILGAISDRFGRRNLLFVFCIGGILTTVPLLAALGSASARRWPASCCSAPGDRELLHLDLGRAEGRALPGRDPRAGRRPVLRHRQRAVRRHGGIRGAALQGRGNEGGFAWYVVAMMVVALVAVLFMPDMQKHGHMRDEHSPPR
jgi:MFS family permease